MVRIDHRTSRRNRKSCGREAEKSDSGATVRRNRTIIGGDRSMAATSKRGGADRLMVLVLLPASFLAATAEGVLKIRLAADL